MGKRLSNIELGTKFGRLTVLEQQEKSNYKCLCECGNIILVNKKRLLYHHTLSCGCLRKELLTKRNKATAKAENLDIPKEELYQYYVVENHSEKEAVKHFKTSFGVLESRLKEYGVTKNGIRAKHVVHYPPKEELVELYYKKEMSIKDISEEFGCCQATVRKMFQYYDIQKVSDKENRRRISEKYRKKTGYNSPLQNPEVKDKIKKTCLERYGVEKPSASELSKNHMRETLKNKSKETKNKNN